MEIISNTIDQKEKGKSMEMSTEDFQRYLEKALKTAERNYGFDPSDVDNLLFLFHESINMVPAAVSKLEEALSINPEKHEAMWCLGCALTLYGLMTPSYVVADNCFVRAYEVFGEALEKDPNNQKYLQACLGIAQAPEHHAEIHKQGYAQQAAGAGSGSSSNSSAAKNELGKTKPSEKVVTSMGMSAEDFEQLVYLKQARKDAERNYGEYPNDAANLTRWGAVLLDLSLFQTDADLLTAELKSMVLDGISKLEEALSINPEMHDAIWCLGNGHMMHGLLIPDYNVARDYFDRAAEYYRQAVEKDPGNQKYLHSSIRAAEASKLHAEIYKHGVAQQAAGAGSGSSNSSAKVNTSPSTSSMEV